jgi:hypothetical protein
VRTKFLIWRLIQHGFFTASWGALWGVCDAVCPLCNLHDESTQHLFFVCPNVHQRWVTLIQLLDRTSCSFGQVQSPMDIICAAVKFQARSPSRLILVAEMLWAFWTDSNHEVFQSVLCQTPIQIILRRSLLKFQSLTECTAASHKVAALTADMAQLNAILDQLIPAPVAPLV